MTLAKEKLPSYDGGIAKAYKAQKARSAFVGLHNADLPMDLEYEGWTVDEMSKALTEEYLPQGFDLEKLQNWLAEIKLKH